MHAHSIEGFRHEHVFLGQDHDRNERMTWGVIAVCGAMMVAVIVGGLLFGSMALLADGLHMSTHAGALFHRGNGLYLCAPARGATAGALCFRRQVNSGSLPDIPARSCLR